MECVSTEQFCKNVYTDKFAEHIYTKMQIMSEDILTSVRLLLCNCESHTGSCLGADSGEHHEDSDGWMVGMPRVQGLNLGCGVLYDLRKGE